MFVKIQDYNFWISDKAEADLEKAVTQLRGEIDNVWPEMTPEQRHVAVTVIIASYLAERAGL